EPPAPIPGLPPTMQHVLDRALAKNVEDRFQTPAEFADAFTAAVQNQGDYSTLDLLSTSGKTTKRPAKKIFGQTKKQRTWVAPVLAALIVVGLGATFLLRGLPAFSPPANASSSQTSTTIQATVSLTSTLASTPPPAILLGRTGVLQFKNASALGDEASLIAEALLAPPPGNQYEVWLSNEDERISLGILTLDENGRGELTFKQPDGTNLIALYDTVEVTIEPDPDSSPASSGVVAYSFTLPAEGLVHVRYLLTAFPTTPNNNALIQGLFTDVEKINDLASAMQRAADSGDQAHVLFNAEGINNIIVGSKSSAHKDWDGNGEVYDPSDGFGLLLNGQNPGYLQAVFTEADAAVTSPNASEQMVQYGKGVQLSVNNLAQWTTELQALISGIQNSNDSANTKLQVANAAALANKMLNGIDADSNGTIDPVSGEGGAQTAYDQAYHMADMPLRPVGIFNLGTGTPTFVAVSATSSGGGGGGGGSGSTAVPTQRIPPGQQRTPKPPKTPRPHGNNASSDTTTNNTNNGGGNGNGNNP
ncbi:MAG TPA: anti-sigma factor, partial [Anaerolineales bacterium]|nr:anti-sigma factor [Anaerolineales bacterium]